jgi:peptide/nickel transport system permease protein
MIRYILKRLLLGLITLIGVSIIVFAASRSTGDVALMLLPRNATPEQIQAMHVKLGTDKPIPVQYVVYVKNALRGDFGKSINYDRPTMQIIADRIPVTLQLGLTAFVIGNVLGLLFGVLSATRRNKWLTGATTIFGLLGQAMPNFWIGIILIMVFAVQLHWLPTSGIGGINKLILPAFALSWFSIAFVMRITRSAMLDVMDSEYIKTARTKGNPEWLVIWKHALRNAAIPIVSMAGMQLAFLIGGAVFIETVFRRPGIGVLMINSINNRDYPVTEAIVLIITVSIILINLLVDILYVFIDPRIKYE